ncbi:MAG: formamidopyrimidine-DNA glycosylase, partial [Acidobacteria bacterium]|nr:formamidopyrimidine-DNA glycosylase [Acidobacteriota bacterium]
MPELPDVVVYVEALRERIVARTLRRVIIRGPFLLRSTTPTVASALGRMVRDVRRVGKRIAIGAEADIWLVLHLMIAGRLHWKQGEVKPATRNLLALFEFDNGSVLFTEAGSRHRASLTLAEGEEGLRTLDAGGLEVLEASAGAFGKVLTSSNHTLKRALTDPRTFSGIGNAYSDEILHRACLSPIAMTQKLSDGDIERLFTAVRDVLLEWVARLREQAGGSF